MLDIEELVKKMVEYKEEHNLTWKELSSLMGCGESTIRFWAAGKRIPSGLGLVALINFINREE